MRPAPRVLAIGASALTLFGVLACSSNAKEPPTVAGGAHSPVGQGEVMATHDAGFDVISAVDDGGDPQQLACSYLMPGTTGTVCALLLEVAAADLVTQQADCASSAFNGNPVAACPTDSLQGCCVLAVTGTPSFGAPNAVCYYPGDTATAQTCTTSGGTWQASPP